MSLLLFISPASAIPKFTKTEAPSSTIPVRVAIHITTITEVSSVSESWSCSGYVVYSWNDLKVKDGLYELEKIWHPGIEMVNMISTDISDSLATAKGGNITVQERFTAKLSAQMEFSKFPKDTQRLEIDIESLRDSGVFLMAHTFTISGDGFTALSEWRVLGTSIEKSKSFFPPENVDYSRLIFNLNVSRNGDFFINKIVIPIVLLTIASMTALFVPTNEFSTATAITMTTGLSSLTLWLLSSDNVPKTVVVSMLDRIVFTSLLTNVIVFFFIVALFHRGSRTAFLPPVVRRLARVLIPVCYVLVIIRFFYFS
jgi:Neurotransmitter-gated ion-channel ligand binding domain